MIQYWFTEVHFHDNMFYNVFILSNYVIIGNWAINMASIKTLFAGVEFRRELQESIWILLGGVCERNSPPFSLCETFDSLQESNWILAD